jgi:hypothetical protein
MLLILLQYTRTRVQDTMKKTVHSLNIMSNLSRAFRIHTHTQNLAVTSST